tara:strand:+ start:419 stop:1312 length:894 start_codon:yes stop_codon:yes gene_type:complete
MKRLLLYFVIVSTGVLTVFSCKNKEKRNNTNDALSTINDSLNQNKNNSKLNQDWNLVWSDEFDGDAIDENNWNLQVVEPGHFNDEWQRYTNSSENAYVENGNLVIKAIHESDVHGMGQYSSARLNTANKQAFKYGKIAARIKLPCSNGIWPSFWMLGANINENGGDTPWPQSGEIDILELYGSKNDSIVEANLHYADKSNTHAQMGAASFELKAGKFADAFHVFELEWDADSVTWMVDGEEYASMAIAADELSEFHKEFFILLNIAVGGKWAGRPDAESVFPQYMFVDWLRVYKKNQ